MKLEIGDNIDNIYGNRHSKTFRENPSEQGKRKRTDDENSPPEKRCV